MRAKPTQKDFNSMTIGAYMKLQEEWAEEAEKEIARINKLNLEMAISHPDYNPLRAKLAKAEKEIEMKKGSIAVLALELDIQVTAARKQAALFVESNKAYEKEIEQLKK